MKEQQEITQQMTNQQRKSIIKKCKTKDDWSNVESAQDKLIEKECISLGFILSDFYACDGKTLNKFLS